jgi:glycosyltransferase involved in cell wall biosynthesis
MNECALPQVSVLMAVHNGLPHLHEAVRSILAQTFGDFEFVIVDDGSTDGTPAVLAEYAASDDRIRLLKNERNLGLTPSLNVGLRASRAALVARQDADDVSLPGRLAAQTAFMDAHPEVALLGTVAMLIDDAGRPVRQMATPLSDAGIRWQMLFNNALCHTSVLFWRVPDGGPVLYDESFRCAQDYDLWVRMQECGQVRNLPETFVQFRRHDASISAVQRAEQARLAAAISLANMRILLDSDSVAKDSAVSLRGWWACPPRHIRVSDRTVCDLLLDLLAAITKSCPSAAVVRDMVLGRVAMALPDADEWATDMRSKMQKRAPDVDLGALAAAAERELRASGDWGRGLRWRAWESARAGQCREAMRNLRDAVAVSPRLLLSPRTWLVPVRALVGCTGCCRR